MPGNVKDQFGVKLNKRVQYYWEQEPCGTSPELIGDLQTLTPEWFAAIESYRYWAEPFIHSFVQFTRYHQHKVLEIGVGAGTDHLQWARAGADYYGVDLTRAALKTTRAHLELHGFEPKLQNIDAEVLPFPSETFDVVYSWGVIHHSENPKQIINEIRRVLKPGGVFIGMMYGRHSLAVIKYWLKHAFLRGHPWRSLSDVVWRHVESIGTKAYTVPELSALFSEFKQFSATPIVTKSDTGKLPEWAGRLIPGRWGWFIALRVIK